MAPADGFVWHVSVWSASASAELGTSVVLCRPQVGHSCSDSEEDSLVTDEGGEQRWQIECPQQVNEMGGRVGV